MADGIHDRNPSADRFWRDAGFAVGAGVTGIVADWAGPVTAILVVGALTAASGVVVAWRMTETHTKTEGALLQVPPT